MDAARASSPRARTLLVLACLAAPLAAGTGAPARERPNVLFISIDDLNDWVGCLGGPAPTPNLDRLAARGVLFANAHAPAPACNPARVALMTGIAPHRSGLYGQETSFRKALPASLTLPQRLQASGYTTLGAGKVFHHPFPDPLSWDDFYPSKDVQIAPDLAARRLERVFRNAYRGIVDAPGSQLGDGQVAEWICAQLSAPHEKPFFLACGFFRPHVPWVAPASSFEKFPLSTIVRPATTADDLEDVPEAGLRFTGKQPAEREHSLEAIQAYLACVSFVDDQLGRVLDALERGPFAANTIVVLWSDNGYHLGQKQHWGKMTLWEESTHVPLVIVAPQAKRGAVCTRAVSLQDLGPTLMELCGLPPVAGLDGQSLVPLLATPEAPWERPALTTWGRANHALRSERWRYIRYADGSEELYDHAQDPHEWKNLAADPAQAATKAELARWLPAEDARDLGDK